MVVERHVTVIVLNDAIKEHLEGCVGVLRTGMEYN